MYLVCLEVCLLEVAWRAALLGRQVLVRLYPREMHPVCPEVCPLEATSRVALPQAK
jgi:hypothetical protein